MKKIILVITLLALGIAETKASTSFNRRWGANSMIANLPLFFKPYQYEQYNSCHDSEFCKNKTQCNRECIKKKSVNRGTKGCSGCSSAPAATTRRVNDKSRTVTVTVDNNERAVKNTRVAQSKQRALQNQNQRIARKESKKLATSQFHTMRQRQAELEVEKTKLQRELAELERKKQEFGLAKV